MCTNSDLVSKYLPILRKVWEKEIKKEKECGSSWQFTLKTKYWTAKTLDACVMAKALMARTIAQFRENNLYFYCVANTTEVEVQMQYSRYPLGCDTVFFSLGVDLFHQQPLTSSRGSVDIDCGNGNGIDCGNDKPSEIPAVDVNNLNATTENLLHGTT